MTPQTDMKKYDPKETHVVVLILKQDTTLPKDLALQTPFHIHYRDDGELEVFWLVNNNYGRVK